MILELDQVHAFYGKSHVLQGVSLNVGEGELVTLLGRNGAGKSTTLKSIVGAIAPRAGQVRFRGAPIHTLPAHRIARLGACLVPEHRGIFKLLTVEENLLLGARRDSPWKLPYVYRIFPRLQERRRNGGGQLSGGEQQMLAIGRAMMARPTLLLLDEPSLGIAPKLVVQIFESIKKIAEAGVTILVVEQNTRIALKYSQRAYVLKTGEIAMQGPSAELAQNEEIRAAYLGG